MDSIIDLPSGLDGVPMLVTLAVLALLDGLSVGTLLIPVLLLLDPGRVRAGRILLYLGTIAGFYFGVGVLLLAGFTGLVEVAGKVLASPAGQVGRLGAGVGLILASFWISARGKRQREAAEAAVASGTAPGSAAGGVAVAQGTRLARWRERLLDARTPPLAVAGVAVDAGLLEVATMLPYLAAAGVLADSSLSVPGRGFALAAYCAVMVLPALVLLALRVVAQPLVQRPLERLGAWLERNGAENTSWIVGIVGFFVARGAAEELGLFRVLTSLGG